LTKNKYSHNSFKAKVIQNFLKKTAPSRLRFDLLNKIKRTNILPLTATSTFSPNRYGATNGFYSYKNKTVFITQNFKNYHNTTDLLLHEMLHSIKVKVFDGLNDEKNKQLSLLVVGKEERDFNIIKQNNFENKSFLRKVVFIRMAAKKMALTLDLTPRKCICAFRDFIRSKDRDNTNFDIFPSDEQVIANFGRHLRCAFSLKNMGPFGVVTDSPTTEAIVELSALTLAYKILKSKKNFFYPSGDVYNKMIIHMLRVNNGTIFGIYDPNTETIVQYDAVNVKSIKDSFLSNHKKELFACSDCLAYGKRFRYPAIYAGLSKKKLYWHTDSIVREYGHKPIFRFQVKKEMRGIISGRMHLQ
jgi:hypothetical protein